MRNARRLLATLVIGFALVGCSDTTAPRLPSPDSGEDDEPPPKTGMVFEVGGMVFEVGVFA